MTYTVDVWLPHLRDPGRRGHIVRATYLVCAEVNDIELLLLELVFGLRIRRDIWARRHRRQIRDWGPWLTWFEPLYAACEADYRERWEAERDEAADERRDG
jgi:hypothetical protein